jgi:hypothetical protein
MPGVSLSSLRVVTEGDSTSYVSSMSDVARSSDAATVSVQKFTDSQGAQQTATVRTVDVLNNAQSRFERLSRSLDPAYAASVRFAQAQTTIQGALERGATSTDRANQLLALAEGRFAAATKTASPLEPVLKGISAQMIALSAGAGPVGVALAGFGPLGLAAAAGLGAVSAAIEYVTSESERFGDATSHLRDFSETAGTTSETMQVLQRAGAGVGLSTDQLLGSFERFSVSLSEMQKGAGAFYIELQKVSPELTRQLATTKDAAAAWDILAKAYADADTRQQALIAHAAFGRGGAGTGRLLTATAEAGGVAGLQRQNPPIISDDEASRIGALKTALDQARASAKDVTASLFTEETLQKELRAAQLMKQIAESTKEIAQADGGKNWISRIIDSMTQLDAGAIGERAPSLPAPTDMDRARSRLSTGLTSLQLTGSKGTDWAGSIYASKDYAGAPGPNLPSAEFIANQTKATVSALGTAATAYEQQKVKLLDLDMALRNNTIDQDAYNRAVSGVKLQTTIELESQRLSLLGELAPVSETVYQKELALASARQKGVDITKAESAAILDLTRTQAEGAKLQQAVTAGVASEAAIRRQLTGELRGNIEKGIIDPKDATAMANATTALEKSIERMSEQAKLARAPLEGLAKLEADSGNFRLQVDNTSVSTLNSLSTSLVDIASGSKTAGAAFQNLGQTVVRALEEMLIKMTIVAPLAKSLQASLGGFFGTPGAGAGGGFLGTFGFHRGGMTDEPTFGRYVPAAVFAGAPRFHGGIGPGEVPAIIQDDEGVFTKKQMAHLAPVGRSGGGSGGGYQQVNVHNYSGGDVKTRRRQSGNTSIVDVVVGAVGDNVANGRLDAPFKARFGSQVKPISR